MNEEEITQLINEGYSDDEINSILDEIEASEGKTPELQTEDAAVAQDGASNLEDGSSELTAEQHNARAEALKATAFAGTHMPEFLQEPIMTFLGTLGEIGAGAAKAIEQHAYSRAQDLVADGTVDPIGSRAEGILKTDAELEAMTPEERVEIFKNWSVVGDEIAEAAAPLLENQEIHGSGSISTEFGKGHYGNAAQLTANQTAGGLASLVPFIIPGGSVLGPSLLGGSVVGGEFEAGIEREDVTMDQVRTASYAKGANEFAWEFVTAGIIGKAGKLAGKGAAREAVDKYAKASWKSVLGDTFNEGFSEGLTDTGNRVIDKFVFGDEFDGKAAVTGFLDSAIVGAIVGGKVSTFGQIGKSPAGVDIIANALKTDAQRAEDAADLKILEETEAIITEKKDKEVEGSLVDQVVLEEAETQQDEAIERIKERQKEHVATLEDMTNPELVEYAEAKDAADKLEEEKKKLEKEEKPVPQALNDRIAEKRAAQAQQYAVVSTWEATVAEQDRINEEIQKEIDFVEMEEKQAAKSEIPNPVGTAKRNDKLKELKEKKEGLDKAVDSLRPTHAKAKTRKRQAKAPTPSKEGAKPIRDKAKREAANAEIIATVTDASIPDGQKEKAWSDYFKINAPLITNLANNAARKAGVNPSKAVRDLIQTEIVRQVGNKGEINNKVYNNAEKAVERLLKSESQTVRGPKKDAGLKEELREIDQQVQDGILDPEAAEILKDDIRAEYNAIQPKTTGIEFEGEEGNQINPEVEKKQTKKEVDNERKLIERALADTGGIDVLLDDLSANTEAIFALLPKSAKNGKAFSGIFSSGNPAVEIWESYFDNSDRQGKDRIRQLKKALEARVAEVQLDSDNVSDTDIMDGAFEFLEGKGPTVKKFLPLLGMLKRAFPGVKVIISKARMIEDFIEAGIDPGKADHIKGYTDGNVVVLNPDKLDYETPIHEFGHIWAQATRLNRPELYQKGVELMKQTPYWNELIEKSQDPDSVYYGHSKKRLEEEGVATMLGKSGESFFEQQEDISQWNELSKKIWDWIGQQLGISKIENLTLDQFNKLAVTEIITGEQFVKPEDVTRTEKSLITEYLQVPVGSTRTYTPSTKPVAEVDTHGSFNGKKLKAEALNTINRYYDELSNGGWIGYTTGTYGDAVVGTPKFNAKLNSKVEAKVKGLEQTFKEEGYEFKQDPQNAGFHIVRKSGLEFLEESPKKKTQQALTDHATKELAARISEVLEPENPGAVHKFSKVSKEAREKLSATLEDLRRRGNQLTPGQLYQVSTAVAKEIEKGEAYISDVKQAQEQSKTETREESDNILDDSPKDADDYQSRDKFVNRVKRVKLSSLLAPAANNDFQTLLYRLLPNGKNRLSTQQKIDNLLTNPLVKANTEFLKHKQRLRAQWKVHKDAFDKSGTKLTDQSGITITNNKAEGYDLNNGEIIKAYNYIKDPNLRGQLDRGGIDLEVSKQIVEYVHNNDALRQYANGISETYASIAPAINNKLNEHGRTTFTAPEIDKDNLSPEEIEILESVYGYVPKNAVYTPVTAEGQDLDTEVDSLLDKGNYDMYTVMDGRLKSRTGAGEIYVDGSNPDAEFESYLRGPVRTLAFLDFAKNVENFFGPDQIKAMKFKYGDVWTESMKDVLKRTVSGRNSPQRKSPAGAFIEKTLQRQVTGIMFFNVRSALLQHLSYFNYMFDDLGAVRKGSGATKAEREAVAEKMAPYLDDRGRGKTELFADELFGRNSQHLFDRIGEKGYSLTKWGDKNAISRGGALYMAGKYKQYKEGGMPEAEALEQAYQDFYKVTEATQQSTNPEKLGREQTTGLGKYILAFANTPQQYNRKISRAIQDLKGLKGVKGKDASKAKKKAVADIMWYMGAQNAIFTSLQSLTFAAVGFDSGDDDDRAINWGNSLVNTLLRGAGIYGALAAAAKDVLIAVAREKDVINSITNIMPAVGTLTRNIQKATGQKRLYAQSELASEVDDDLAKALYQIAAGATVVGLPGDKALKITEQVADVVYSDLNILERLARASGYSRYQLDAPAQRSPLKSGVSNVQGRANKDGSIEIDPNLSPIEREKTIAHEEKHMAEMEAGVLDYDDTSITYHGERFDRKDGKVRYDGEWLEEGSKQFPWEQEAYEAEPA